MLDGKNKRTFVLMSSQKSCLESGVPIKAMRFDLWDVEALVPINKCVHSLITYKAFSEIYIKWKYRTGTTLFFFFPKATETTIYLQTIYLHLLK